MVTEYHVQILAGFPAVWLWGSCLTSLGFGFLISKLQVIKVNTSWILTSQGVQIKLSYVCEVIEKCLAQGRTGIVEGFSITIMMEEQSRQAC